MFSQGYLIDTQLCIIALWLLYIALLHRRINLTMSRAYLLCLLPVGMLLPLLEIPLLPSLPVIEMPVELMTTLSSLPTIEEPETQISVFVQILEWVYWLGAFTLVIWTMVQILRMWIRIRKSSVQMIGTDRVVFSSKIASAYSVFGVIFVNNKYEGSPQLGQILAHERSHITHFHSADLVWMSLVRSLLWFNPVSWHTLKMLREVHEFQADRSVIIAGNPLSSYIELLIGTESGIYPNIVNALCYSLTKKRLKMITKTKHGNTLGTYLRLATIIPVTALLLGAFSLTAKSAEVEPKLDLPAADSVYVTKTSSSLNSLDSSPSVTIRSAATLNSKNSPLYVIDGVIVSADNAKNNTSLKSMNPEDYKHITVLKDSAAIKVYGDQGANGAIVITTTKGAAKTDSISGHVPTVKVTHIKVDNLMQDLKLSMEAFKLSLDTNESERDEVLKEFRIAMDDGGYVTLGGSGGTVVMNGVTVMENGVVVEGVNEMLKKAGAQVVPRAKSNKNSAKFQQKTSSTKISDMIYVIDGVITATPIKSGEYETAVVLTGEDAISAYGERAEGGAFVVTTKKEKKSKK